MHPEHFTLEMWQDADGTCPVEQFLDGLPEPKRSAVEAALGHVLARRGVDVCRSEWGKQLGGGLFEFRIRHELHEVLGAVRPDLVSQWTTEPVKVLVRVFCHAHGDKVILLLGGYDKGVNSHKRQQDAQIEAARRRLREFRREQRRGRSYLDRWRIRRRTGLVR